MWLLAPFAFLAIFLVTAIHEGVFHKCLFYAQALVYGLGGIGIVLTRFNLRFGICTLPSTFLMMYTAAVVGLYRFLTKTLKVRWDR